TRCLSDWSSDVCSSDLDDVSGTTIVDANEVMTCSLRVRNEGAIQKDHGNSSLIEGADNSSVVLVLGGRQFQRREEHSGDPALDEIGRASCRERVERGVR